MNKDSPTARALANREEDWEEQWRRLTLMIVFRLFVFSGEKSCKVTGVVDGDSTITSLSKITSKSSRDYLGNTVLQSFINKASLRKNYQSTSGAFSQSSLSALSKVDDKCLHRYCLNSIAWTEYPVLILSTPQSCSESFGLHDKSGKYVSLSKSELEKTLTSLNANARLKVFLHISFLVFSLIVALRWKTSSRAKLKLKTCGEDSARPVCGRLSKLTKAWGTIFVLSSFSEPGNSSSITSSVAASSNETTFNTPWTSRTILDGLTPVPSSLSFMDSRITNFAQLNTQSNLPTVTNNISEAALLQNGPPSTSSTVTLASSSFHLSVSDSQTLPIPDNSLTSYSMPLTSGSSHLANIDLATVVDSSINKTLAPSSVSLKTPSLTTAYISSTTSLANAISKSSHSLIISTQVVADFSFSSVLDDSATMTRATMQSSKFTTSNTVFIEASSLSKWTTDVAITERRSSSMALHKNEGPAHSTSGVTSSMFNSVRGASSISGLVFSLTSSTSKSTTVLTSESQGNDPTMISSSSLSTLLPSSSRSTSALSSPIPSEPLWSTHDLPSTSTASFPLEFSSPSFQSPLSSTITVTLITSSTSSLSSVLLLTTRLTLLSQKMSLQAPSSTLPSLPSSESLLLSRSSQSLSQSSPSRTLSPPPSSSSSQSLTSRPSQSSEPSLPMPSSLRSASISLPSSLQSPTSSPSSPLAQSQSSRSPPLPSPLSPSPSQSSLQPSLMSSSPSSSSSSSSSSPSSSSLSSPSPPPLITSLLTASSRPLSTMPPLLPSETSLPSFSLPSLFITSTASNGSQFSETLLTLSTSPTIAKSDSLPPQNSTVSSIGTLMSANVTSQTTSSVNASVTLSEISPQTPIGSASSSIAISPPTTSPSDRTRIINLTVSLVNEEFHSDLLNEKSVKFMNLSRRVNSTVGIFHYQCLLFLITLL